MLWDYHRAWILPRKIWGVGLPGGNAGEPFCVLGLGAEIPLQLLNNLQREAGIFTDC